jgi:acetyltransferase-like isoleucine patch superfamily enzyme
MSATQKMELSKPRPANALKTLSRLWPAAILIAFRVLTHGRRALYFRHPLATISGEMRVGRFAEIGAHVYINAGQDGVDIGAYTQINALTTVVGNVRIGDRVLIAPGCSIVAGGHRFGKGVQPRFAGGGGEKRIVVEDDVWIGAGVTVVGQVTIGHGSVIAAGVTVDQDVPAETLVRRGPCTLVFEPLR